MEYLKRFPINLILWFSFQHHKTYLIFGVKNIDKDYINQIIIQIIIIRPILIIVVPSVIRKLIKFLPCFA